LVGIDNDDESIAALPKGPKKQRCDENVEFTKEARPLPIKTTPGCANMTNARLDHAIAITSKTATCTYSTIYKRALFEPYCRSTHQICPNSALKAKGIKS
jgi:hypothetical protein